MSNSSSSSCTRRHSLEIDLAGVSYSPSAKTAILSPTSKLLAAGYPRSFILLICFCFAAAFLALGGFIAYSSATSSGPIDGDSLFHSPMFLLSIGILNSLIGSLQTATGYCCQRIAHKLVAINPAVGPTHKHPIFITGLLLLAAGTIAAVMNLGLMGQSVTAPFAALTLLYNACLARFILKEVITRWDIYSSALVVLGVGIAVYAVSLADIQVQSFVLAEIQAAFFRSALPITYTAVMIALICILTTYIEKHRLQTSAQGLLCFSFSAGLLAGFTSLCVKCSIELVKGAIQRDSGDMRNPVSYIFFAGIVLSLSAQLRFMNKGFEHFGTLKFVPPYHAFIILSNMVNGLIYFEEGESYSHLSAGLFFTGCIITIAGVMILLAKSKTSTQIEEPTTPLPQTPSEHL